MTFSVTARSGGTRAATRRAALLTALLLAGLPAAGAEPAAAQPKSLEARPASSPIVLDGVLDEKAWADADVGTGFVQREPDTGKPESQRTEVRVVYTPTTLYVGLSLYDDEPGRIIYKEMQRDQPLWRDDAVDVVLDTFDDKRNAYLFETNSNGARTDALITEEGRDFNLNWNGVWDVAAKRTPEGWFAEMAIPFTTLRFDPKAQAWGFNVLRYMRRRAEQSFWAPILLDADVKRVSRYGRLTGIRDVREGWNLNVKPFVTGALKSSLTPSGEYRDDDSVDFGGDLKWGIARALSLDLTVNTDFAETEVDDLQTNLTRFSLFQSEKREFFLENAGIFEFGPGAVGNGMVTAMSVGALSFGASGSSGTAPLMKVFHSRRIGIGPSGEEVPIDFGGRVTGRLGDWNLGVLDVQTDDADLLAGTGQIPSTNFATMRVSRNIGERSTAGMIFTQRAEDANTNRVFGLDLHLRPTKELAIDGYGAVSDNTAPDGESDWSAALVGTWNGSVWHAQAGWVRIGEDFDPEVGFLLRRGVDRYNGRVTYEPWLRTRSILNLHFEADAQVYYGIDGRKETEEYRVDLFGLRTTSAAEAKAFVTETFDSLTAPFQIAPGVVIPPGDYRFDAAGLSFLTHSSKPVSVEGQVLAGEFYDGNRQSGSLLLRLRPNRFLRSETTVEVNNVTLSTGDFTAKIFRERIALALDPKLLANLYLQYNDLAQLASVNFRFNWNYRPGSDVFLVYNQTWVAPSLSSMVRKDRQLMLKVTYLFQM
ncbi:MAG: hypothetical protein EDX89_02850 [Acidobacteria bacterium]|nr:MAG: hypothetical protein EDX89_02850 [Acidobacteriota bacterium]MCE7959364.1 hypothetical protein [Acidobacteria bacterium ACB2]